MTTDGWLSAIREASDRIHMTKRVKHDIAKLVIPPLPVARDYILGCLQAADIDTELSDKRCADRFTVTVAGTEKWHWWPTGIEGQNVTLVFRADWILQEHRRPTYQQIKAVERIREQFQQTKTVELPYIPEYYYGQVSVELRYPRGTGYFERLEFDRLRNCAERAVAPKLFSSVYGPTHFHPDEWDALVQQFPTLVLEEMRQRCSYEIKMHDVLMNNARYRALFGS